MDPSQPIRRYVGGKNFTDATPQPLPVTTFTAFVNEWLSAPVILPLARADYFAMSDKDQKAAKNTEYFCAGFFAGDGRRNLANVRKLTLLVLDVDDADAARHLLTVHDTIPWNFCLWHTLTSTPEAPRVRLVVDAGDMTRSVYAQGVKWLAQRLDVRRYDPHSEDASHLWYRPSVFADAANAVPIVASRVGGAPVSPAEWEGWEPTAAEPTEDEAPEDISELPAGDVSEENARGMLEHLDPDVDYGTWVKVLCALKHQFGKAGFDLFDEWSSGGSKYPGRDETLKKWNAFSAHPKGRPATTIRSLVGLAIEAGWKAADGGAAAVAALEQLIAEAEPKVALRAIHESPLLDAMDRQALMQKLSRKSGMSVSVLRKCAAELTKPAGAGGNGATPPEMQGYVYVRELNLWVHPGKGTRLSPQSFDTGFAAVVPSDAGRPSIYAVRGLSFSVVDREAYEPRKPKALIFEDDSHRLILNTYRRSYPAPDEERAEEAGRIFDHHLRLLFPDTQWRNLLLSWMTWCLTNPGEKAKWHVFIQGAPGCGKTLVAEALATVFGPTNARKVSNRMLQDNFNGWIQNTLFAFFEEVLVGERQKDTMEELKDLVTGATANIRMMRTDVVERPNMINGMFLSNHLHGLRLDRTDRRFFCLCTQQQQSHHVAAMPRSHFEGVARLKRDLAGGLRNWLLNRPLDEGFDPNGHAPETPWRDLVIRAGASEVDTAVTNVIESGVNPLCGRVVCCSQTLLSLVRSEVRHVTSKQIGRVLTEMGYTKVGQRDLTDDQRVTLWVQSPLLPEGWQPLMYLREEIKKHEEII